MQKVVKREKKLTFEKYFRSYDIFNFAFSSVVKTIYFIALKHPEAYEPAERCAIFHLIYVSLIKNSLIILR